jgi:protein SCO1/2
MQKNSKLFSFIFGGLFSLFVPLGAYYYLKLNGHDGHVQLPKQYGIDTVLEKMVDGKIVKDTQYHVVKNVQLINHLGDTINVNNAFKGKILVTNFFFTSCQTICPTLTHNMQLLNKAFKKNDTSIRFLSITVDPERDSVSRLRTYANKLNPNHDKWFFLTGNKADIYNYARKELLLDLPDGNGNDEDFIHPDKFVLIDKYRNIRGYYNGLDSNNVRLCAEDISYLMIEKNKIHEKRKR